MASGSFLVALGATIGGALGAAVLDRKYGDKSVQLGPVTLTPGAMAALGATGLMLAGVRLPSWASALTLGALVHEGTEIGENQVLPALDKAFPSLGLGAPAPAKTGGEDYAGGYLTTGIPDPQFESALQAMRSI